MRKYVFWLLFWMFSGCILSYLCYSLLELFPLCVNRMLTSVSAGAVISMLLWLGIHETNNRNKIHNLNEFGSARWGTKEDIRPMMDANPKNNIILTATESIALSDEHLPPAYRRNKNVLVVGGSGSGKTRYYVKPNILQMHSSYVITDSNGYNLVG